MYTYYRKDVDGEYIPMMKFRTWWQLYVHRPTIASWLKPKRLEGRTFIEFDEGGMTHRYEIDDE